MNLDRAWAMLARVLEHDTAEQPAFLEQACEGDEALQNEVRSLLDARRNMDDGFLTAPARRPAPPPLSPGERIAGFEILGRIGGGGSGTVYEALQEQPRRRVALKVMRADLAAKRPQARFLEEAEILARLDHPDIAHVYDAGVVDGVPYFAMELVTGGEPVTAYEGDRLRLFARLCDAVHHGHQKGVIHRDLKPQNVLVKPGGRLKVIDFGIARMGALGGADVAGTLPYMSPEQLGNEDVDVRTDVYALGVLLYELLTRALPLRLSSKNLKEARAAIREQPPEPFDGPADLRAVVSKALAKDRNDRYASATALADDVRRYLAHEPVEAYRGGVLYQTRKFARRNRVAFFAVVAILGVSIAAAVVSGRLAVEREEQRQSAEFQAYVSNMAAAYAAHRVADVGEARLRLDQAAPDLRNWEWHHLNGRLDTSRRTLVRSERMRAGAVSPNGRVIVTTGGNLRAWGAAAGALLWRHDDNAVFAQFDPAGNRIADCQGPEFRIRDARTGEVLLRKRGVHEGRIRTISFHPEGTQVATASADGTVKVWSAEDGALVHTLFCGKPVHVAVFSPDGRRIATGGVEGTIRLWSTETGSETASLNGHRNFVEDLAFSPDGELLVSGDMEGVVRLWDVQAKAPRARATGHRLYVKAVAFAADGRSFASAGADRTVRVWSARDGRELARHVGHTQLIYGLETHPEGVVSFSTDGTARLWSTAKRDDVRTVGRTGVYRIERLDFSFDGTALALGGNPNGRVQIRDGHSLGSLGEARAAAGGIRDLCFDRHGTLLALAGSRRAFWTWRLPAHPVERKIRFVACDAYTRGRVSCTSRHLSFEEAHRQETVPHMESVTALAARGWKRFALGTADGRVVVWDEAPLADALLFQEPVQTIAVNRMGTRVAALAERLLLLDGRTLGVVAELKGHGDPRDVAFSPDGTRLASGGDDGTVRIWDTGTGTQVAVLHGHLDAVYSVAWSPDGARIASGTHQGELKLWCVREVR